MTLCEFFLHQNRDDFETVEEARNFMEIMFTQMLEIDRKFPDSGVHYGDCTKKNITCTMCTMMDILNDYYEYTKNFSKETTSQC